MKIEWRKALKEHNKLSRALKRSAENRRLKTQQRKFDKDFLVRGEAPLRFCQALDFSSDKEGHYGEKMRRKGR